VWLDAALGADPVAKDILRALVCDCFMTKEASSFSVLSVIGTVVAGAGGVQQLFDTAQCLHSRVVGGSQALADGLAARLAPATVRLNAAVRRVRWASDAVEVHTGTLCIRARYAIIATPPNIAAALQYAPPLPQWRADVHAGCTQGSVIKVLVEYARPFWRDAGLAGEGFAPHALVKEVYDNSPPSGVPGVLCVFLTGPVADAARATDAAARRELVLNGVAAFFGARARTDAIAVHECDWSGEEFTRGGYCGTFAVGALTRCGRDRTRPVGPLHFCCTELAGEGHMHMEGALRSGAAAAADVHTRLGAHGASKL
jgi:putrescine oxidase